MTVELSATHAITAIYYRYWAMTAQSCILFILQHQFHFIHPAASMHVGFHMTLGTDVASNLLLVMCKVTCKS